MDSIALPLTATEPQTEAEYQAAFEQCMAEIDRRIESMSQRQPRSERLDAEIQRLQEENRALLASLKSFKR